VADQHWIRVVGYLQPPPAREVFRASGYYRGTPRPRSTAMAGGAGAVAVAAPAVGAPPSPDLEISAGDRLIYLALGQFVLFAVGTVTAGPDPHPTDPDKKLCTVQTDVFIPAVLKAPHFAGEVLPSGRDLRLIVQQYTYIWVSPEDGRALIERVQAKAGAKD
jgi:hypothetical protein